ncbi:hypothetical protein ACFY04_41905 [Streptomyces sp. NPDC001549]|uniref:hypothetical protein n=1 Tax=Streptomyces sp. NPDC001549 TaxID=3364586 RepID=UPI0036951E7C
MSTGVRWADIGEKENEDTSVCGRRSDVAAPLKRSACRLVIDTAPTASLTIPFHHSKPSRSLTLLVDTETDSSDSTSLAVIALPTAVAGKVCRGAASGAVYRKAEGRGSYWTYVRGPTTRRGAVPGVVTR